MLDVYLRGDVERISPEAPVPVVRVRERAHALGGAANVAQNVAAVGAQCELVGALGDDAAGRMVREILARFGAHDRSLVTVSRATTTKTRIVARAQQVVRVDEEDDADVTGTEVGRLLAAVEQAVGTADAVVLEDYNKGVLVPAVIEAATRAAQARGIPVVVDPKFRNFFRYRGATIFKPNRRELEAALGAAVDLDSPRALHDAVERLDVGHLLLALSPGPNNKPALAAGATPLEAAIVANYAAGVEVGKSGAATVSAAEVLEAYDAHAADGTATSSGGPDRGAPAYT